MYKRQGLIRQKGFPQFKLPKFEKGGFKEAFKGIKLLKFVLVPKGKGFTFVNLKRFFDIKGRKLILEKIGGKKVIREPRPTKPFEAETILEQIEKTKEVPKTPLQLIPPTGVISKAFQAARPELKGRVAIGGIAIGAIQKQKPIFKPGLIGKAPDIKELFKQVPRFKQIEKTIQRPIMRQDEFQRQIPIQRQRFGERLISEEIITTVEIPIQEIIQKEKLITTPKLTFEEPPTTIPRFGRPLFTPPTFFFPPFKFKPRLTFKTRFPKFKTPRIKKRPTPSVSAVLLDIRGGKAQSFTTGFELRKLPPADKMFVGFGIPKKRRRRKR